MKSFLEHPTSQLLSWRLVPIILGLTLGLHAIVSEADEPLAKRRLTADDIVALAQTRPAWCFRRSSDGMHCKSMGKIATQPDGRKQFRYLVLTTDSAGSTVKLQRSTFIEVGNVGLCNTVDEFARTERLAFSTTNDRAILEDNDTPLNDESQAHSATFEARTFRLQAEQRGIQLDDRFCLQIEQVGTGHQHYVMTPVWVPGSARESHDNVSVETFEALADDPGLRLENHGRLRQ